MAAALLNDSSSLVGTMVNAMTAADGPDAFDGFLTCLLTAVWLFFVSFGGQENQWNRLSLLLTCWDGRKRQFVVES